MAGIGLGMGRGMGEEWGVSISYGFRVGKSRSFCLVPAGLKLATYELNLSSGPKKTAHIKEVFFDQ